MKRAPGAVAGVMAALDAAGSAFAQAPAAPGSIGAAVQEVLMTLSTAF